MTWTTDKLVVVGIDGGSWNVLEPWCRREVMPTLTTLRHEGSFGVLRSVIPPITPTAWSSLLSGQHPGRHRVLDFVRYDPSAGNLTLVNSSDLPPNNIFSLLSGAGKDIISINVPMTYPPPPVRGCLVSGFETPSADCTFTSPAGLREEVLHVAPDYRFAVPWQARGPGDLDGLAGDARTIVQSFADRARLARHLTAGRPWNLLLVHLKFFDDLLHKAFGYTRADADPRGRALIERCFRGLDTGLAELRALAREAGAPLLLVSDHGFGSLDGRVYPNALLHRWGYLALKGRLGRLAHRLRRRLSPGDGPARGVGERIPIDWPRTRAYIMFTGPCPFIYLNRRGREPFGSVGPDRAQALTEELAERFRAYRHPAVDGPVFEQVIPGEEFFVGDRASAPDLVLVPKEGLVPRRRLSRFGEEVQLEDTIEGYHRLAGMWLAAGPNVARDVPLEAHLEDLVPTVLAALGIEVPRGIDGRPWLELFAKPPEVRQRQGAPSLAGEHRDVYSADEEREVRRRLEDLGYL